ncbi:hypothetical protein PCE1_000669 [Barthelona sp. PCE]
MSDFEVQTIENTGSSCSFKHATEIKKGEVIKIQDCPCSVKSFRHVRNGKHGHVRVVFNAYHVFSGRKYEWMVSGDSIVSVVDVERVNMVVQAMNNGACDLMDLETFELFEGVPIKPDQVATVEKAYNKIDPNGSKEMIAMVSRALDLEYVAAYKLQEMEY